MLEIKKEDNQYIKAVEVKILVIVILIISNWLEIKTCGIFILFNRKKN